MIWEKRKSIFSFDCWGRLPRFTLGWQLSFILRLWLNSVVGIISTKFHLVFWMAYFNKIIFISVIVIIIIFCHKNWTYISKWMGKPVVVVLLCLFVSFFFFFVFCFFFVFVFVFVFCFVLFVFVCLFVCLFFWGVLFFVFLRNTSQLQKEDEVIFSSPSGSDFVSLWPNTGKTCTPRIYRGESCIFFPWKAGFVRWAGKWILWQMTTCTQENVHVVYFLLFC